MGQAAVQPGAPEALVPSDHPAHYGAAEAPTQARGPSSAGDVASAITPTAPARPHLPSITAQRIIVTPRRVDG